MNSETPDQKEGRAAYRERWEAVEVARARELAAMTEERAAQIIRSLRPFTPVSPDPSNGMGLVAQQSIFHGRRLP